MFVDLLVKVVEPLFHLFARILFDNLTQLLFVEGQLVAHLLLADALSHTSLDSFKEMLQGRDKSSAITPILHTMTLKDVLTYVEFFQRLAQRVDNVGLQVVCVFVLGLSPLHVQAGDLQT